MFWFVLFVIVVIILVVHQRQKENTQRLEQHRPDYIEDYTRKSGSYSDEQMDLLYRRYASIIDEYHITPLSMFEEILNQNPDRVISDLNLLIQNGRFQKAHIEYDDGTFVVDEYTKTRSGQKKAWDDAPEREKTPEERASNAAKKVIDAVEKTSPYVRDETMRDILSGIESSTNDIVKKIHEDPGLITGDLRRFLNFYLPKTVECVENYRELLQKNDLTDMEISAKNDLESALTAIRKAFRKILKSIANNDAIDVSAEAKAIQQMLENDGLADD